MKHKIVCIVGLGYVGLPLANAFSKHLKVIGFDVDEGKIRNFGNNNNNGKNIEFTSDPSKIKQADFVIIAVPTPVTKSNLMRQTCDMSNIFASQKPLLKNAYAIRSRNCRQESKARCHSGIRIHCLSGRYRRSCCSELRTRIKDELRY